MSSAEVKNKNIKLIAGKKAINYSFIKSKSGYLVHKRELKPFVRFILSLVKSLLKWIVDKQEENNEINRSILISIGLPPDTAISSLDAFYKKEFRKKKYIYFFKSRPQVKMSEPTKFLFEYIPKDMSRIKKTSFKESLRSFTKKT